MKFLVVDDDPAILKMVQTLLEFAGHHVQSCENALDAIKTLNDLSYDILITDATMPAYSGFDLIRTVKKKSALKNLSVAMLTGRSEKGDIEQALELGVHDYIVKPIEPELFLEKMKRLVERHPKNQDSHKDMIRIEANLQHSITVIQITDIGVRIESPHPITKGMIVKIDLPELKKVGIRQNQFKVIFNTLNANTKDCVVELLLLHLSSKDQEVLSSLAKKWMSNRAA